MLKKNFESLYSAAFSTLNQYEDVINSKIFPEIKQRIANGGTIFTCGNGGSACCANHLTEELIGKYQKVRPPIRSICLNADAATITCISNDYLYNNVFSRQIEGLGKNGDVLVVFSTSGNSINILNALDSAHNLDILKVAFVGNDGGLVVRPNRVDHLVVVDSNVSARIQEIHEFLMHNLCEYLENDK